MKIGILTQPLDVNYGCLLQNYALQQVLSRLGHEVYTINRNSRLRLHVRYTIKQIVRGLLGLPRRPATLTRDLVAQHMSTISENNKHIALLI